MRRRLGIRAFGINAYNLACAESRAGRTADALAHLGEAIRGNPAYAERATNDPDFDPVRGEPGFPAP